MGQLTVTRQRDEWQMLFNKIDEPNLSASFSNVEASTSLFKEDDAIAEVAVFNEDGQILFHPYIRRKCPYNREYTDLCSAYEFGGFWFSTAEEEKRNDLLRGFESAFKRYALEENFVSEFCRINPFCNLSEAIFTEYETIHADNHVVIPLSGGYDAVWNEFSGTRRTQIRQGQKNALRVEFSNDIDTFIEIYHKRLSALNSYKFYYFEKEYLKKLTNKQTVFVYGKRDEICGAQIWLQDKDVLFYFLSADVVEKRDQYAGAFAINEMIKHAIFWGKSYVHLGGGADTLNVYKKRFSPHSIAYYQAKQIFNPEIYQELVVRHATHKGALSNKGYFPLYRLDTDTEHKLSNRRRYTATQNL